MAPYLGDFAEDEVVHFLWATNGADGASITRSTNGTVSVYKDNGTTQSTAGVTDTEDFDSLTGIHACTIDTSADAFYAAGANYTVVLSGATVDTKTVNAVLAHFSIQNRVVASVTGSVGSVTGAVGSVTGNVGGNVSGSVGSVTGAVGSVTGNVGGNVTGSVGSVATGGITAGSFAADAITAAKIAADVTTELQSGLATAAALTSVAGDVTAILADTNELQGDWANGGRLDLILDARASQASVDTIDDFLDTEVAAILADTNELQTDWVNGGRLDLLVDAIKAKTDNLPASPAATGDIPTAAAVADAVWDEALAGHAGAGSAGEALAAAGTAGDPWTTALPGSYSSGQAGYIIGTNLNATVSSRLASAGYTAPLDAAGVRTAVGLASANLDTQLGDIPTVAEMNARTLAAADYATATNLATVDTVVDAVKAKTDSLTFTVAGQVDANIQYVNDTQIQGTGAVGTDEWRAV